MKSALADHVLSYETARLHRHYRSEPDTDEGIFRNEDEAMNWLGEPVTSLYSDAG